MHEGGCFCGHVRYRIISQPIFDCSSHCRDCQETDGIGIRHQRLGRSRRSDERWPAVTGGSRQGRDARTARRCSGPSRVRRPDPVPSASARSTSLKLIEPDAHFFVSRKHHWVAASRRFRPLRTSGPDDPSPMSAGAYWVAAKGGADWTAPGRPGSFSSLAYRHLYLRKISGVDIRPGQHHRI